MQAMDVTTVTAVVGLLLSSGLAALRIYELRARPVLNMHFKWVRSPHGNTLTWVIANVGRKKVIINEVRFLRPNDSKENGLIWEQPPDQERGIIIPTVLEPDDATYTVSILEAGKYGAFGDDLAEHLRSGQITGCVVETFERRGVVLRTFDVPPRPR
jgi:hypothetical protein